MPMQPLSIATSALIAQSAVVAVIADNIANARTPDYAQRSASLVSMNPGVKVGAIFTAPQSGVDLVAQFTDLMLARTAYEASLKAMSASAAMSRALLQTA